ncbi:radical SAM protein [Salinarimonas sp.]|uniref:radical SAM protein n=1 Tax=Salinarimonas sp. TaxID=2766526 RepID=UPI00391BF231
MSATLYLTNHCQYRCDHCFLTDSGALNSFHLPTADARKVIDDLSRNKVLMVVISGGDPMLHPDFIEIVRYTRSRSLVPLIGINALEYDEERLDALLSIGITDFQVSIDAVAGHLHGSRTLEDHEPALRRMTTKGFRVAVAVTVHSGNVDGCPALAARLLELGCASLKISMWRETGTGRSRGLRQVTDVEAADLRRRLVDIAGARSDALRFPEMYQDADGVWRLERLPPERLVIRADGTIGSSETSRAIGRIGDGDVVRLYRETKARSAQDARTRVLGRAMAEVGVGRVWDVPRSALGAGGAVAASETERIIMIADDLSPAERLFTALHEIGHLKAGTLSREPRSTPRRVEIDANLAAIETLAEIIPARFAEKLRLIARSDDEDALFREIRHKLDEQIATLEHAPT